MSVISSQVNWRIRTDQLLTRCFPVMKLIKLLVFIGFCEPQWSNHDLHHLTTVLELRVSPVVKIAVSPLISHFGAHIFGIGLDTSVKNRCSLQNPQHCIQVTCVIKPYKSIKVGVRYESVSQLIHCFLSCVFILVDTTGIKESMV